MAEKKEALWFIYRDGRMGRYLPALGYIWADYNKLPPLAYRKWGNQDLASDVVRVVTRQVEDR